MMFGKNKKPSDSFLNGRKKYQINNILGRMTALLMACMLFSLYVLEAYAFPYLAVMSINMNEFYAAERSTGNIEITIVYSDEAGSYNFETSEYYNDISFHIYRKKPGSDDLVTIKLGDSPTIVKATDTVTCTTTITAKELVPDEDAALTGDYTLIIRPTNAPVNDDISKTITYKEDEVGLLIPNFTFNEGSVTPTVTFNGSDISSDTLKYVLKYKKDSEEDSAYDEVAPVDAGSYTAKVTVTGSAVTNTANFTIDKADGSATLAIDDIAYGGTLSPLFSSTNGTEYESLKYKKKGADDGTYTDTIPIEVGDYTAKITFAATENYKACEKTADFSIAAIDGDAIFSVEDIIYGETLSPHYESSTNGIDSVTTTYKVSGADDSTYTPIVPTDAGDYTAKAVFAAKDQYKEVVRTDDFTIAKAAGSGSLTVTINEDGNLTMTPESDTNGTENVTYRYKVKGAADSTYVSTQPTEIGEYTAEATFAATANYKAVIATADFEIAALAGTGTFQVADIIYGQTINPVYTSTTNGTDNVTITYKVKDAADSTYSSVKPIDSGTYTAKAVFAAKGLYGEVELTDDFTIEKAEGSGSLTVTVNADGSITKTPVSSTNGITNVTYQYKVKGAADSTYSSAMPTETGEYTIHATFAETTNYKEATATADFALTVLEGTATFQVADIIYGQTINSIYTSTTNGTDNVTITYKVKGAADSTYTSSKPTDAGNYTAKAVFGAKGLYGEIVLTDDFAIAKAEGSGSVTVKVNEDGGLTLTPKSTTNGTDNVTYRYKVKDAADSTYVSTQPTAVGSYTVQATFAETDNYKEVKATANFDIALLEGTATFQVADIVYGQTVNPVYTSDTNGTDHVTITYKEKDAEDTTYSETKPTDAGTYTAKAVFPAKGLYGEVVKTANFTISKAEGSGSVTVAVNADGSLTLTSESSTNGTENVTYQYKEKGAADSTYVSTQPTAVGSYTVQATFAETDNYKEVKATANFDIALLEGTATFQVADIVYGQTVKPVYSSSTNGTKNVTISYKTKDASESTYSSTKPKNAGEYTAKAVFAAKGTYGEIVLTDDFTIEKAEGKGSLKATADSAGSITLTPVSSTNGITNVTYQYKVKGAADSTYSGVRPTEVGEYTVQATFAATTNYKEVTAVADFEIPKLVKKKGSGSIKVSDITYGEGTITATLTSKTNGTDHVTIEYKTKGAADSTYTTAVPTEVGKYTARATFAETDTYNQVVAVTDFEIKEQKTEEQKPANTTPVLKNGKATLTIKDTSYGQGSISAYITSATNGSDNATILYKKQGESDSSYSETVPTVPGKYTAKAILPATEKYKEVVTFTDFEIKKAKSNVSVKVSDLYYGETVEPVLATNRDKSAAVYEYKEKGASDENYSGNVPSKVGEYTVRVSYPEDAYYLQAESTDDFKISYMPTPIFAFDGVKGSNGFFTSSVKVMPPKGYLVSTRQNGEYSDMLLLTENEHYDTVYFKNSHTGAISAASALGDYEIDATKPEFADAPLQQNVYADSLKFSLEDKNLMSVLVNGEEMELNGSRIDFELTSEGGYKEYNILATDRAGNVNELHFTLSSPWLQSRIVPANENIMLEKHTEYFLSKDSSWKVAGDDTVYFGGGSFYIKNDGNYMFKKN